MTTQLPHLLCFGLGYCGRSLSDHLLRAGWRVTGTRRSVDHSAENAGSAVKEIEFPGAPDDLGEIREALLQATHVISTAPPSDEGDPVLNRLRSDFENSNHLEWIGYLSTTGVYGNTDGAVVDESTPVNPSGIRGSRRVTAERQWMALHEQHDLPVHIFRLPGIYGPARSTFDQLRKGKARQIHKPGHRFNRIHVEDITTTLTASIKKPDPGNIYNVCDDLPMEPAEVTRYAANLMGMTLPPLVSFDEAKADMSAMALSFWQDNRQVSNAKIKTELGVSLRYPDFRTGLDAIWAEEQKICG